MVGFELLSQDHEVGFMGGRSEHDEVSVGTVEAVVHVSVVVRGAALPAKVVHYLEEDEGGRSVGCRREKWSGTRRGKGSGGGSGEGTGRGGVAPGGDKGGPGYV